MPSDSKFTRDDDGNVAVRVVSNTGVSEQPESMFTTDEDGNVAVRVVFGEGGGGGGDSHNKGFYATPTALNEAVPTAEAGDYAIVGSTDTVWIWDTDTNAWVDSDQKGQVTSVNNRTGAVTVSEVPSQTGNAGKFLTTDGTDASWGTTINGAYKNIVTFSGYVPMFESVDNSNKSKFLISYSSNGYSGSIVFRDSDANYKSGFTFENNGSRKLIFPIGTGFSFGNPYAPWKNIYIEKINNGADITVPAVAGSISVQCDTMATADSSMEGKIVQFTGTTDATYTNGHFYKCVSDGQDPATYSWTEVSMGGSSLPSQTGNAGKFLVTDGTDASWGNLEVSSNADVFRAKRTDNTSTMGFRLTSGLNYGVTELRTGIGSSYNNWDTQTLFSFKYDRSSPSARYASFYVYGNSVDVKYLGESSNKWTTVYVTKINNGSDITVPNATGEMVVNKATGTESLSISGNVATGMYDTNVGYKSSASGNGAAFGFNAIVYNGGVACGRWAQATGQSSTAVGNMPTAGGSYSVAIGCEAKTTANYAIQISAKYGYTNADANTFKVGNNNGNFEMMSADGTIPTARLTKVNTTVTLAVADWSSNTQTVNVTGMTATGVVLVSPDPTDQSAYTSNGILCTAQAAGTLTFTCDTVPSGDIDVNVVML